MCGIIAITGKDTIKIDDGAVSRMLSCLDKRGPDDKGFERIGNAILGQTRLAIVDLSPAGHQPMRDNSAPLTIVFNGEIYGYKEVRAELESRGHKFSSHSDTEVILKAYAEYGEKCVDHLDGMFAFAIWDEAKKEMFVARDRFGKKPFYYAWVGENTEKTFVMASEIKALLATNLVKGEIDPDAVDDFLRLLYIPPYRTIYSNIHTLPPAHAGVVKNGELKSWKYWKLEKKKTEVTYDDAKQEIKRLFDDAVRKRMVADVEVGSLLSGGVDSTLVTAIAQKHASFPIKTFSVGYEGDKSELPFALEASKAIGTDHYTLNARGNDITELKNVIAYFDEPHADSSDFPQHLVSKLAASKVKVALSGDGADELFMGYGWYQKYWHTPRWKRIFMNPFSAYKKATTIFTDNERRKLLKTPTTSVLPEPQGKDSFDKINLFDLTTYLPGQLLSKVDRTGMMHSLEVRSPFLDTKLAEYVYNLPRTFRLSKTENKIILKDILTEIFPREFVYRRKQGFGAPLMDWMNEPSIQSELARIANTENHPIYVYLNKSAVQTYLNPTTSYNKSTVQKAWSILCLALWLESRN